MIVVSIIALLAAVGIPSFLGSRTEAKKPVKKGNKSTVNAAKDPWAILYNKTAGTTVNWSDLEDYVGGGITNQAGLDVDGDSITINPIGTEASS